MRSRRPSQEHNDAVARRVAELSAQLAASRSSSVAGELDRAAGDDWSSDHSHAATRPPLSVVPAGDDAVAPTDWTRDGTRDEAAAPSRLLVPGRHAHRRSRARAPDLMTAPWHGRVRLGPPQLTAVAVLVAAGLAFTCWWIVRGDPEPAIPVTHSPPPLAAGAPLVAAESDGEASHTSPGLPPAASSSAAASVTVDVAGKVRRPGIVVLEAGARVIDALEEAGGAGPRVDLTALNLARVLMDGEQLLVGLDPVPGPLAVPSAGATPTALVDLNLADQASLETLPQVGPVTASAIVAWRTEHGAFTAVTELLEVDGIGEATLAQVSPYVTV